MKDCYLNGDNCRAFKRTDDACNIIVKRKAVEKMVTVKAWCYPNNIFGSCLYEYAGEKDTVPCTITYLKVKP